MNSGIYTITNLLNGKMYVGYALNLSKRWDKHKSELKYKRHRNKHLQNAWDLYGESIFKFEVLEYWDREYLPSMEHWWCLMLGVHEDEFGYNIKPTHPEDKIFCSQETKEKCRLANIGRVVSQETRQKVANNKIGNKNWEGKTHKESTKQKMREWNLGKVMSEESRAKMRASAQKRREREKQLKTQNLYQ